MSVRRTAQVEDVLWVLGRVTLYSGVAAWVVSTVAIAAAIAVAPWFSWTGNALSGLGNPVEPSSFAFNDGLILAGVLGTVFVVRASRVRERSPLDRRHHPRVRRLPGVARVGDPRYATVPGGVDRTGGNSILAEESGRRSAVIFD